ncbi:hypothetical protein FKM82_030165 [Ascaphus truei]
MVVLSSYGRGSSGAASAGSGGTALAGASQDGWWRWRCRFRPLFSGERSSSTSPEPALRLSGSVMSLGIRISTGSRLRDGRGEDLGVSALRFRFTSSSRRLLRLSGSKMLPPSRNLDGRTGSQSELTRRRRLKGAGCLKLTLKLLRLFPWKPLRGARGRF